jgi:hypothetical protein
VDVRETGWGDIGWIHLTQDRDQWKALVDTRLNLRIPYSVAKFMCGWTIGSYSTRTQFHVVTSVYSDSLDIAFLQQTHAVSA